MIFDLTELTPNHPDRTIQTAMIANGKMMAEETQHEDQCPQSWTDFPCQIEETQKTSWNDIESMGWNSNFEINQESSNGQEIFAEFMNELRWPQAAPWYGASQEDTCNGISYTSTFPDISNSTGISNNISPHPSFPPPNTKMDCAAKVQAMKTETLSPFAQSATPQTSPSIRRFRKPDLEAKRIVKLSKFLDALRNHPTPSLQDHNEKVSALYNSLRFPYSEKDVSMLQFAGILSQIGDVSTTVGFVYTLLSWEIFRREELFLLHRQNVAANLAARQVNQRMADLLKRGCKAKDWASDGRRAAEMVFRAMKNASFAASSCALILLGDVSSLDCMLKIAHFPILRQRFEESFANFVYSRATQWEELVFKGYQMFDFEEFLQQRGRAYWGTPALTGSNCIVNIGNFPTSS